MSPSAIPPARPRSTSSALAATTSVDRGVEGVGDGPQGGVLVGPAEQGEPPRGLTGPGREVGDACDVGRVEGGDGSGCHGTSVGRGGRTAYGHLKEPRRGGRMAGVTTILSIQSSVAYGHVGNSAAVFPLQRLGVEVWPVHTVHFSNHTGYGAWRGPLLAADDVREVITGIEERDVLPDDRRGALGLPGRRGDR